MMQIGSDARMGFRFRVDGVILCEEIVCVYLLSLLLCVLFSSLLLTSKELQLIFHSDKFPSA